MFARFVENIAVRYLFATHMDLFCLDVSSKSNLCLFQALHVYVCGMHECVYVYFMCRVTCVYERIFVLANTCEGLALASGISIHHFHFLKQSLWMNPDLANAG